MKKANLVLMSVGALMFLVACGGDSSESVTPQAKEEVDPKGDKTDKDEKGETQDVLDEKALNTFSNNLWDSIKKENRDVFSIESNLDLKTVYENISS